MCSGEGDSTGIPPDDRVGWTHWHCWADLAAKCHYLVPRSAISRCRVRQGRQRTCCCTAGGRDQHYCIVEGQHEEDAACNATATCWAAAAVGWLTPLPVGQLATSFFLRCFNWGSTHVCGYPTPPRPVFWSTGVVRCRERQRQRETEREATVDNVNWDG